MRKKKTSTVEKAKRPDLSRRERRAMAKRIRQASQFTEAELVKEITEHPNGVLSVACCVDFLWDRFCQKYGLEPPVRENKMTDEEWAREQQAFQNFIVSEKNVAKFWYLMGLSHHSETHQQFVDALQGCPATDEGSGSGSGQA